MLAVERARAGGTGVVFHVVESAGGVVMEAPAAGLGGGGCHAEGGGALAVGAGHQGQGFVDAVTEARVHEPFLVPDADGEGQVVAAGAFGFGVACTPA